MEKGKCSKLGASKDDMGLWRNGLLYCLSKAVYAMMADLTHGLAHSDKNAMAASVQKSWIAPGFPAFVAKYVFSCVTCLRHIPVQTIFSKRHWNMDKETYVY
ncbi:hypothetical protein XELAEV_18031432mg [Xenopus laevis]|uniref:Uncharacterized protein n=1 Tax=Xenopus laevis TaxID=8355 RepID=A0A974CMK6_XENLA|nr:hypothetical protein XELAEV_18031432mg [Xenopus laevis]